MQLKLEVTELKGSLKIYILLTTFCDNILQEPFKRCDVCILTKEARPACNKTFQEKEKVSLGSGDQVTLWIVETNTF